MRVVIWHGYLLHGTGSNEFSRGLARTLASMGHEVVVLSQDPDPGSLDLAGARTGRPELPGRLPVFVLDRYAGMEPALLPTMDRAELDVFVAEARKLDLRITGLHAHLGSGIDSPAHWRQVHAELVGLAEGLGTVATIDIGGGLPIPYLPDAQPFDIATWAQELAAVKAAYPAYALAIEPGRYLVAESGVLLLHVTQVVEKDGVQRIGADAGMNALLRPALYEAFHDIINLSRADSETSTFDVVGPICESGDVLGHRRDLPIDTAEGDVLLVADAGAYGMAMANTYNLRALPAEDVMDD